MARPVIALDADGVLLDYHLAYADAWQRAFGEYPAERDPQAYWPMDRWKVPKLRLWRRSRFRSEFGELFLRKAAGGSQGSDAFAECVDERLIQHSANYTHCMQGDLHTESSGDQSGKSRGSLGSLEFKL